MQLKLIFWEIMKYRFLEYGKKNLRNKYDKRSIKVTRKILNDEK